MHLLVAWWEGIFCYFQKHVPAEKEPEGSLFRSPRGIIKAHLKRTHPQKNFGGATFGFPGRLVQKKGEECM